jgi:hypothetical protein
MMHFNTVYRLKRFEYEEKNLLYDEFTEMKILKKYVQKFDVINTPDILHWCITESLSHFPMKPDWWLEKIRHMGRTPPTSVTGRGDRPAVRPWRGNSAVHWK